MLNSGSVLGSNPPKALGLSVEGWFALKWSMPFALQGTTIGTSEAHGGHYSPIIRCLMGPYKPFLNSWDDGLCWVY